MNFEEVNRVQQIRWFNLSFKPAVEKLLASGKISKYIAEKLLSPVEKLERKRVPKAVIPQPSNMEAALQEQDHDEHLLLQGHERGLQQQERGSQDSPLLQDHAIRLDRADGVPEIVQAPERRNAAPVSAQPKLCGHIWSCACKT